MRKNTPHAISVHGHAADKKDRVPLAVGGIGHHGAERVSHQFSRMGGEASYPPNRYERACSLSERWLRWPPRGGSTAGVLLGRHAFIVTKTSSASRVRFRTNESFEVSVDRSLSEGPCGTFYFRWSALDSA